VAGKTFNKYQILTAEAPQLYDVSTTKNGSRRNDQCGSVSLPTPDELGEI